MYSKHLLVVDVDHTLTVSITKVGVMRRTVVDHSLVDGISSLIRENTGGKTRDNLLDLDAQHNTTDKRVLHSFPFLLPHLHCIPWIAIRCCRS